MFDPGGGDALANSDSEQVAGAPHFPTIWAPSRTFPQALLVASRRNGLHELTRFEQAPRSLLTVSTPIAKPLAWKGCGSSREWGAPLAAEEKKRKEFERKW
jgi:hypothetical protein